MPIKYSVVRGETLTLTHDPDNIEVYTFLYKPEVWSAGREVIQDDIILLPTVPNGCMYTVSQGGITGSVEPVWRTAKGARTESGTVKFVTVPYNLQFRTGDTITAYELLPTVGVTIDNASLINSSIIRFRVTAALNSFSITIRITVLLASGLTTQYDDTINFTLKSN